MLFNSGTQHKTFACNLLVVILRVIPTEEDRVQLLGNASNKDSGPLTTLE